MRNKYNSVDLHCTKPGAMVKLLQALQAHSFVAASIDDGHGNSVSYFQAQDEMGDSLNLVLKGVFKGDVVMSHHVGLKFEESGESSSTSSNEQVSGDKDAWGLLQTPEVGVTRLLFSGPYMAASSTSLGSRVARFLHKGLEVDMDALQNLQIAMDKNDTPYSYKIVHNTFASSMEEFKDAFAFALVPDFTDKLVVLMCDCSKQGEAPVLVPKLLYAPLGVDI